MELLLRFFGWGIVVSAWGFLTPIDIPNCWRALSVLNQVKRGMIIAQNLQNWSCFFLAQRAKFLKTSIFFKFFDSFWQVFCAYNGFEKLQTQLARRNVCWWKKSMWAFLGPDFGNLGPNSKWVGFGPSLAQKKTLVVRKPVDTPCLGLLQISWSAINIFIWAPVYTFFEQKSPAAVLIVGLKKFEGAFAIFRSVLTVENYNNGVCWIFKVFDDVPCLQSFNILQFDFIEFEYFQTIENMPKKMFFFVTSEPPIYVNPLTVRPDTPWPATPMTSFPWSASFGSSSSFSS